MMIFTYPQAAFPAGVSQSSQSSSPQWVESPDGQDWINKINRKWSKYVNESVLLYYCRRKYDKEF